MALEPGVEFDIVLDADQGKPEAEQRRFTYVSLSARDFSALEALFFKDREKSTTEEVLNDHEKIAQMGLVRWSGVRLAGEEVPFEPAKLQDVLSAAGLMALAAQRRQAEIMGHEDKKKSESPA